MKKYLIFLALIPVASCNGADQTVDCMLGKSKHHYEDKNKQSHLTIEKNGVHLSMSFIDVSSNTEEVDVNLIKEGDLFSIGYLQVPIRIDDHVGSLGQNCSFSENRGGVGLVGSGQLVTISCKGKFDASDQEVVIENGKGITRWSTLQDGETVSNYELRGDVGLLGDCIQFSRTRSEDS